MSVSLVDNLTGHFRNSDLSLRGHVQINFLCHPLCIRDGAREKERVNETAALKLTEECFTEVFHYIYLLF